MAVLLGTVVVVVVVVVVMMMVVVVSFGSKKMTFWPKERLFKQMLGKPTWKHLTIDERNV